MTNKDFANLSKPDIEILNEFEGIDREIAKELLSLRQPASPALRQRVRDITRTQQTKPVAVKWWTFQRALAPIGIGLLILIILAAVPQVRASVAQILRLLQGNGFAGGIFPDEVTPLTLSPTPIFTVRQPDSLPDGFERTNFYYRSHLQVAFTEQLLEVPSNPILAPRLGAYNSNDSHLLILYQASDNQYFLLFQRAAHDNEPLPDGRSVTLQDHPASLQAQGGILILTWIADDTWITLETNTSESSLLSMAQELKVTQQPEPDSAESLADNLPLCDSGNLKSQHQLLGKVDNQTFWGSIWIFLYKDEASAPTVASGIDMAGLNEERLFQRGLDALRDPSLANQDLSTPADVVVSNVVSPDQQCLKPNSDLSGYVVLEVWDQQVNAAFVGSDSNLKERAITALENKLAK
jgi:hypothetical protein